MTTPNERAALEAVVTLGLHDGGQWRRANEPGCSGLRGT
jgi:hypothetical protein